VTWIYVPLSDTLSSSPPEVGCSERPSSSLSTRWGGYEPFVMLSDKPKRRPASWAGWKTRPWIERLSGMTLPRSTIRASLDSFVNSLDLCRGSSSPDTPASPSLLRGIALARKILDTYGPTLTGSLASMSRSSCFWRTSPAMFRPEPTPSGGISNQEATALRSDFSRREKWARRRRENAFTSSVFWPTPTSCGAGNDLTLSKSGEGREKPNKLGWAVSLWPAPTVDNFRTRGGDRKDELGLPRLAKQWPNAMASDTRNKGAFGNGSEKLSGVMMNWPTALANDGIKRGIPAAEERNRVPGVALNWPTTAARDAKGANSRKHCKVTGKGRMHMDQLPNVVEWEFMENCRFSLRDEMISRHGSDFFERKDRALNPRFHAWLMGWPPDWTRLGLPLAATEWSRWRRLTLSSLSFHLWLMTGDCSMSDEVTV